MDFALIDDVFLGDDGGRVPRGDGAAGGAMDGAAAGCVPPTPCDFSRADGRIIGVRRVRTRGIFCHVVTFLAARVGCVLGGQGDGGRIVSGGAVSAGRSGLCAQPAARARPAPAARIAALALCGLLCLPGPVAQATEEARRWGKGLPEAAQAILQTPSGSESQGLPGHVRAVIEAGIGEAGTGGLGGADGTGSSGGSGSSGRSSGSGSSGSRYAEPDSAASGASNRSASARLSPDPLFRLYAQTLREEIDPGLLPGYFDADLSALDILLEDHAGELAATDLQPLAAEALMETLLLHGEFERINNTPVLSLSGYLTRDGAACVLLYWYTAGRFEVAPSASL